MILYKCTSSSSASEICGAGSTSLLLFLIDSGLFTLRGKEWGEGGEKGRGRRGKGERMHTYNINDATYGKYNCNTQ